MAVDGYRWRFGVGHLLLGVVFAALCLGAWRMLSVPINRDLVRNLASLFLVVFCGVACASTILGRVRNGLIIGVALGLLVAAIAWLLVVALEDIP
jgi:hypothetical protein